MRIIHAAVAAGLLSFAAATPAFAQYGGSPQQQVDGAPGERAQVPAQDDEDDQAVAPEADDNGEIALRADGYDKPGADEADQGEDYAASGYVDNDVDQGDADTDMDQGDVDNDADQGEVDENQAAPGGGEQAQTWQGEDGRSYCRRSDGTTGLVVGGGAGALVGRGIDGGRHRGVGTIIGGVIGALVGSAVERSANQQSCR